MTNFRIFYVFLSRSLKYYNLIMVFTKRVKSAKFNIRPVVNTGIIYMQNLPKIILIIFALTFLGLVFFRPSKALAQLNSIGIATFVPINNDKVDDGDIVVATSRGYTVSTTPYDTGIAGVVSKNPAISIKTNGTRQGYPVVNIGTVIVKVTGENGNIKKGDYLATSSVPGAGMKIKQNGYVLGQAMEDVKFSKPKDVKTVAVTLNLHYLQLGAPISNSLLDIFNLSKIATYEKPSRVIQYVVAAIIILISFGCGFLIFAKAVNTGLEALGRNPLAGRMIQLSIVFNLILIAVIIMAGTALAYLVIRL